MSEGATRGICTPRLYCQPPPFIYWPSHKLPSLVLKTIESFIFSLIKHAQFLAGIQSDLSENYLFLSHICECTKHKHLLAFPVLIHLVTGVHSYYRTHEKWIFPLQHRKAMTAILHSTFSLLFISQFHIHGLLT